MTTDQTIEDLKAHVDRLTAANLNLIREVAHAKKTLHDWFMGQAVSNPELCRADDAPEVAGQRCERVANALMRAKGRQ